MTRAVFWLCDNGNCPNAYARGLGNSPTWATGPLPMSRKPFNHSGHPTVPDSLGAKMGERESPYLYCSKECMEGRMDALGEKCPHCGFILPEKK